MNEFFEYIFCKKLNHKSCSGAFIHAKSGTTSNHWKRMIYQIKALSVVSIENKSFLKRPKNQKDWCKFFESKTWFNFERVSNCIKLKSPHALKQPYFDEKSRNLFVVFMNVFGTLCATWTSTGYPSSVCSQKELQKSFSHGKTGSLLKTLCSLKSKNKKKMAAVQKNGFTTITLQKQ